MCCRWDIGIKKERPRLKVLDVQTTNYNPMNIYLIQRLLVKLFFSKKPDQSSQLKKIIWDDPWQQIIIPWTYILYDCSLNSSFPKNQISRPNLKKLIWDDPWQQIIIPWTYILYDYSFLIFFFITGWVGGKTQTVFNKSFGWNCFFNVFENQTAVPI